MLDFWRQLDILSPEDLKDLRVTVIGCGGIGSPTVLALAKMGVPNLIVYDDDSIEPHNLPNQFYRITDLGKKKVEALGEIVEEYAGLKIEKRPERFKGQHPLSGVVISGVDTMGSRKEIWKHIKYKPGIPLYIDARMGGEVARIYSINPCDPDDIEFYESMLYDDAEATELRCTARAIIYNVFIIAGLIANQVKKFARAEKVVREIIFDLKTLTFTVDKERR